MLGLSANELLEEPEKITLTATGPHVLLAGVKSLALETDYAAQEWSLRMPYDNFVLTLARTADGEGALFEQRVGEGRVLLSAGGSLFTNRALGNADNSLLFANIVGARMSRDGVVLFDDLRQGLSASYDPARFYRRSRACTRRCSSCSACGWSGCSVPRGCARRAIDRARSFRGRARAARRRVDRAHRCAGTHGAAPVRPVLRGRGARCAPRGRRRRRTRRPVAMARAARARCCRRNSISSRPGMRTRTRRASCRSSPCRTFSIPWKNDSKHEHPSRNFRTIRAARDRARHRRRRGRDPRAVHRAHRARSRAGAGPARVSARRCWRRRWRACSAANSSACRAPRT